MARYYMLHKPKGCISACSDPRRKTVMEIFSPEEREGLFPVGRLDKDTEGLLLVTDDGELCYNLLSPVSKIPKTYLLFALGSISYDAIQELEGGVNIYDGERGLTSPAIIEVLGSSTLKNIKHLLDGKDVSLADRKPDTVVTELKITIFEGKKHQVKRMIGYVGSRVLYLKRISMGALVLDDALPVGEYRELTSDELKRLY